MTDNARATQLATRLERGWQMIEATTDRGKKLRLEDQWLKMLAEYEAACREGDQDA